MPKPQRRRGSAGHVLVPHVVVPLTVASVVVGVAPSSYDEGWCDLFPHWPGCLR